MDGGILNAIVSDVYFSDRECGPKPRVEEEIKDGAWGGIEGFVRSLLFDGSFGADFPDRCPDYPHEPIGSDQEAFYQSLRAEVPDLAFPLDSNTTPPTPAILDLIEFCHRHVAKPSATARHHHYKHWHLTFSRDHGQMEFENRINRVLSRNGLAFELSEEGKVVRLGPPVLHEALGEALFRTGDPELDRMLETARRKFFDTDPAVRR